MHSYILSKNIEDINENDRKYLHEVTSFIVDHLSTYIVFSLVHKDRDLSILDLNYAWQRLNYIPKQIESDEYISTLNLFNLLYRHTVYEYDGNLISSICKIKLIRCGIHIKDVDEFYMDKLINFVKYYIFSYFVRMCTDLSSSGLFDLDRVHSLDREVYESSYEIYDLKSLEDYFNNLIR